MSLQLSARLHRYSSWNAHSEEYTWTVSRGATYISFDEIEQGEQNLLLEQDLRTMVPHAKVYWKRNKLLVFCLEGCIQILGAQVHGSKPSTSRFLRAKERGETRHGDRLVFCSETSRSEIAYRVEIFTETPENDQIETKAVAAPVPPSAPPASFAAEEALCAICMEIQVKSTMLVPCGHLFCRECIESHASCPTCRTPVREKVTSKSLNNLIEGLARQVDRTPVDVKSSSTQKIFDPEDVRVFFQRTGKATKREADTAVKREDRVQKRQRSSQQEPREPDPLDEIFFHQPHDPQQDFLYGLGDSSASAIFID